MMKSVSSMRTHIRYEIRQSTRLIAMTGTILVLACVPVADALSRTLVQVPPVIGVRDLTSSAQQNQQPLITITPTASTQPKSIPNCIKAPMPTPTTLDLDTAATGLTLVNADPAYYTVHGSTASQIQAQIRNCAPGSADGNTAEFTAQTAYNLNWQYGTTNIGNGKCSIDDVKVGVHTITALPQWQPSVEVSAGLASQWNAFMTALKIHEAGHNKLDILYGQRLVDSLNAVGTQNCTTIANTITSTIDSNVTELNTANDHYDTETDHGSTQGAILPTD